MLRMLVTVGFVMILCGIVMAQQEAVPAAVPVQTECPVMKGQPIDPTIFTVYQGRTVYFCCPSCKASFEQEPEKYLSQLPQFQTAVAEPVPAAQPPAKSGGGNRALLFKWVKVTGAVTLVLVVLTVGFGLLRRRWSPRIMLKIHKTCGVCALICGLTHATLIAMVS